MQAKLSILMHTMTVTSQSAVKLSGGVKSGSRAAAAVLVHIDQSLDQSLDQSRGASGRKGVL